MLGGNLGSGSAAIWGPVDASTIYEVVIPQATTFDDFGDDCCMAYGGYHSQTAIATGSGQTTVPYAILCECPGQFGTQDTAQFLGLVLDHETVEASTDPFVDAGGNLTGWASVQPDFVAWELAAGFELGDMCAVRRRPCCGTTPPA